MIMYFNSNKKAQSNKSFEVKDEGLPKGKVLKVAKKYYGEAESNPFDLDPYKQRYNFSGRGDVQTLYRKQTFEYDFAETNRILDTEAFVAALFRKKKALILRNEPVLKSKNPRNADYIQKRLAEMEYVSGVLFYDLLDTIVESLVNYNNVFILKYRNEFSSSGLFREGRAPLASLFVLSPTRLSPIQDENGDTIAYAYRNKINNQQPLILNKDDVYHIYTDKKIDVSVGTPPLEAVRYDIQSLRQMEESIENLVYKHASPLMHVKVGTDNQPAGRLPDGTSEIDHYNRLVQNMENEGGLTTGHRVNVSLIGAESHALRTESSILYFKNRVVSGLKASLLDLGEADSISTAGANAVSKVLRQDVEAYQKTLERFFTHRLFSDILLESKWYAGKVRVLKDEEVELRLQEADMDDRIRNESHLANLVRYGLLSPEAFAKETGRELPPVVPLPDGVQGIVGSDGTFSSIVSPQNQHSTDKEYEVLDRLISSPADKLFTKTFFYVEDNLSGIVDNTVDLATRLSDHIKRYKELGVEDRIINDSARTLLYKEIINNGADQ